MVDGSSRTESKACAAETRHSPRLTLGARRGYTGPLLFVSRTRPRSLRIVVAGGWPLP
ncbi:hypothetical protein [Myxococcus landrumensis]|uniref:Uncharacterized protein n=1 Tax=Myxococcus landrumensis TaxID=2813577 RepID=A0ABX7NJE2_9BACT|nr:hypothetical protein [Myxococcus landrumus]QSQ17647.1 hypothetical protein JY572_17075 [Myxococcus landrumus]